MPSKNKIVEQNEIIIKFTKEFRGIRIIEDKLYPTIWGIRADIMPSDACSNEEIDFSLNKIRYFFDTIINSAIFFSAENAWAMEAFCNKTSNNLVLCPREPSDDHLCLLLKAKMNALANMTLEIGYLELYADTQDIEYMLVGEYILNLPEMKEWVGARSFFDDPWWHRDDASTIDVIPSETADLNAIPEFAFNFDFLKEETIKKKNEDIKVIRPKFKPKIVK